MFLKVSSITFKITEIAIQINVKMYHLVILNVSLLLQVREALAVLALVEKQKRKSSLRIYSNTRLLRCYIRHQLAFMLM